MQLGEAHTCCKCNKNFGWEYATPDTKNIFDLSDPNVSIANAKLVSEKEYTISVKCPKCNALNKFNFKPSCIK